MGVTTMPMQELRDRFRRLFTWRKASCNNATPDQFTEELPVRAELLNAEQLERHAKMIASFHPLSSGRRADRLLPRLTENEAILVNTYDMISAAAARNRRIAPAAEWLLDNFYLMEEQIRSTRRLLPASYSASLPSLASGSNVGVPRVYALALELIAHTDGRVDATALTGFITAYQTVSPLKIGELWALPLMLRLALIENLRRVAVRIARGRCDRDQAADWAERMIHTVEKDPTDLVIVLADMARAGTRLSGAFLAELTRHLQGQNPNFAFTHSWLEHRLSDQGQTSEQLIQRDGQEQAADHVSVGNSITSLRFLSVHDWRTFVAEQSVVEQTLCADPAGVYAKMDFATRDRYRQGVEAIARRSRHSEHDVAYRAIQLAQSETASGNDQRMTHVGYFLIDRGRSALEQLVNMYLTSSVALEKMRRSFPLFVYLAVMSVLTAVGIEIIVRSAAEHGVASYAIWLLMLPLLMCAGQLGASLTNWLASIMLRPQPLPKMDFEHGIPPEFRTLVVVPTMLTNAQAVEHLLEGLEIRYLGNRDSCLHFALLTDLVDAPQETLPSDNELVQLASDGIERLNEKYSAGRKDIFFLMHRNRQWNAQEQVWMGYERKRGKLADLNATLRDAPNRFAVITGERSVLSRIRFVITLDTDTQLPRDTARELAAAMAHPLNRPVYDAEKKRVVDGYTILQPRVGTSLPTSFRSWYVRLFGGDPGVDPYTRVVSDLYQDLFHEGSFVGKGIYDVDVFEKTCSDFPENLILSHDLIESCYSRSGLLSDVVLYEDYPSSFATDANRRHRWMRGDWQIAGWLFPTVRGRSGENVRNPTSLLSRWKIFDNLRRSLVPPAMLALLLIVWLQTPWSFAVFVTVFVFSIPALPPLLTALMDVLRKPTDLPATSHVAASFLAAGKPAAHVLLTLTVIPFEAWLSVDAISRSMGRMFWTHRRLLEWKTSGEASGISESSLLSFGRSMASGPLTALLTFVALLAVRPQNLLLALPLLLAWFVSPVVAWWLSRPITPAPVQLTPVQLDFLRRMSRRTWRYFETFVTAEENWLPPDNVQFNSAEATVASRTSPTNIGMALLANLSAYDFGYCALTRLLQRTTDTLETMSRMERYRGHLLNWYNTTTLAPLLPRYVSTVDSGNLAGQLRILASGFRELVETPIVPESVLHGLRDILGIVLEEAQSSRRSVDRIPARLETGIRRSIETQIDQLSRCPLTLWSVMAALPDVVSLAGNLRKHFAGDSELTWWADALERTCEEQLDDLKQLAAWMVTPAPSDEFLQHGAPRNIESIRNVLAQLCAASPNPTLSEVASLPQQIHPRLDEILAELDPAKPDAPPEASAVIDWLLDLRNSVEQSSVFAATQIQRLEKLADESTLFAEMDFDFLHNNTRDLFAIGFNVSDNRLDTGCYDLLASEARLASFVLIAQGHYGQEHWFALGRLLTNTGGAAALLSWSGSMFEYLMPQLVMPTYENTLLDQTSRAVVRRQIEYGRQRGVPWGISESGYNAVDRNMNYQYRAFGVPGLGLKRGLAEDLVIAPYATALALMVAPEAACRNLERLVNEERDGVYGLFEAVDYTPSRLPPGTTSITVRQVMAHHAGMSLLSLAYTLLDKPMQRRFAADPAFRAVDLLLHERVPRASVPVFPHAIEASAVRIISAEEAGMMRVFSNPAGPVPEVHLLSNGQYHVVITSAGGGYSRWKDLAVTRWREDATRDCWGTFCYLLDVEKGTLWSTAWQPTTRPPEVYEAIFTQARAEFRRQDDQIDTHTQISVSSEEDLELRRITLTNRSLRPRVIELTSYAEVVLATQAQDESHPAFSNLFVQTEIVEQQHAIFCTRRPRSADEQPPWMIHMMRVRGNITMEPSFETDRMKFIGRGRTLAAPRAFEKRGLLSNTQGSTLDPVVCVRHTVLLRPGESANVDVVTGVAATRAGIQAMAEKYSDASLADRVFELAWSRGPITLQQLNATETEAQAYGRLASNIIYASSARRARSGTLVRNRRGQSGLWGYGISGDLPIMLVRIRDSEKIGLVRQAVQAHAYWRMKGLQVDLVIWNEDDSVYRQSLQDSIMDMVAASSEAALLDRPGGVFVRRGDQMSDEDRVLLQTVARVVLNDDAGSLLEQVERRSRNEVQVPAFRAVKRRVAAVAAAEPAQRDLALFNSFGGFSRDGREYVIILRVGMHTPAPWINVIANPWIGTVVSECGSAYTWAENSHEFRLTPWSNDPVSDPCGEAIYIRDEETGRFWSPSPLPARGFNTYITRHGFGYTIFDYSEDGIITELCLYVAVDASIKFARLKIVNQSGRPRHLSITGYWEWVLGEIRSRSLMHVTTTIDQVTGAIFARNPYSPEFSDRVAFVDCSEQSRTYTGDRTEFLGRNGAASNPAAMGRTRLSNRTGAGFDPCAAFQTQVMLENRQERIITFTMGSAIGENGARDLVQRFHGTGNAQQALEGVWHYWSQTLGAIHIETPDPSVNFLTNGWLIYQTLACRLWARTGFYQSGGAYGFRDQLQDTMALIHAEPGLVREHLLRACSRQFREGDVQHWWHPPVGRGVRTHFSDDFLWLPLALCRYVQMTGDTGVLEERIPFLTSRPLHANEEANYDLPTVSDDVGTVYEHAVRAIDNGLRFGVHGLPLIGCGDWNDGMNLIGQHGQGESVWLAFFQYEVLTQFSGLAASRGDSGTADRFVIESGRLRGNIEKNAWDGAWYRRAYFDDGTPLGSSENEECQIDSISQSWSVLSGAGPRERTLMAMESVDRRLIRRDARLIQLLDPPFDKSELNPGYIKGYVPGVRENGGQYTHSAIWTIMAYAAMGETEKAWDLFSLINPVNHGTTAESIAVYRVEPYVVAADVYGVAPHIGRGGWTWYTGSSGWMYRLITESLLGLHRDGDKLILNPRPPRHWPSFKIHYRFRETFYHIVINNGGTGATIASLRVDGAEQQDPFVPLNNDGVHHEVIIQLE